MTNLENSGAPVGTDRRTTANTLSAASPPRLKPAEFAKIAQLAYQTFGLDLRTGKESLVATRLAKHILASGCASFDEYYRHVVGDKTGDALTTLIDALSTNHTAFFREPAHFDFLRADVRKHAGKRSCIEIWSAACSTGEEPFSIAMCLLDELGPITPGKIRILATDISTKALSKAQKAVYPADRLKGVSPTQLQKYWLRGERDWSGWYRAKKELRALVEFRQLNLLEPDSLLGTYPLIFCRNVMIYFDNPTRQRVVARLTESLQPGGCLLIGHSESLNGIRHALEYVSPAVYRKSSSGKR